MTTITGSPYSTSLSAQFNVEIRESGNIPEFLFFDSLPKSCGMTGLLLKEECYKIVGLCMAVQREPGPGFREVIYMDALEYECKESGIAYYLEKGYKIPYKKIVLE